MPLRARRSDREARTELRCLSRPRGGAGGALSGAHLRIAHLLPTLEIGGKERSVVDLCTAAAALDLDPLILTYDRPPAGRGTLDPTAHHIALDRRDPAFTAALRATLARHGVGLVHAHGHVAALYAAAAPGKRIATIHAAPGAWRWLPAVVPALRRMDRLVAVSDDLARATRRLTWRPVDLIPTGIDLACFAGAPERNGPASFTLGIAARLHPVKRHHDLFAAMRRLAERGVAVRLRVAGDGPLAGDLHAAAAAIPGIEMLGAVADMPAFYRTLDAFVLCSDHEGMPLALTEAMASGLPCIATRVGGMIGSIADGTAGVTGVPRRDPAALAEAIARLAASPALRRAAGAAARAASSGRSIAVQAAAYAALYRATAR